MTDTRHLIPIDRIVEMLTARIADLVRAVLPLGVLDGDEWRVGSLAGEKGRSLAVHVGRVRPGVWCDFATGEGGDALELVAAVCFGGNKVEAIKWAKGWLGLDGTDPAALHQTRRAVQRQGTDPDRDDDNDRRAAAMRIYLSAAPLAGSPAEQYLYGRGIDLRRLMFPPGAVRYHPALYHRETRRQHPAMVATIVGADGRQVAIHRTWLEQSGGRWIKLRGVADAKMTLGRFRGGIVPVWKGLRINPETGEITKAPPLSRCKAPVWVDITEGIEDALTVATADPQLRVMAAVSLGNWRNIRLPDVVEGVTLWADNDPPDSAAARGFSGVVAAMLAQGKQVRVVRPPAAYKDANEFVQAAAETGPGTDQTHHTL